MLPNPKHPSTTEKNPSLGIGKRIFSWVLQDVSRFGPRDGGWAEFYIIPAEASSHSYCAGNNTNGAKYISRTCKPCLFNKLCLSIIKHLQGLGHISVDPNLIISRPLLGPTATCIWDPLFNSWVQNGLGLGAQLLVLGFDPLVYQATTYWNQNP